MLEIEDVSARFTELRMGAILISIERKWKSCSAVILDAKKSRPVFLKIDVMWLQRDSS